VWDCTLEPLLRPADGGRLFAMRVGFRYVKGMRVADWERLDRARRERPFTSPEDFADRTGMEDGALVRLAEAGAFVSLSKNRREAIWAVKGLARTEKPALGLSGPERSPDLAKLDLAERVAWDYRTQGLSARAHPLAPLRGALEARGLPDARRVNTMKNGQRVRYAGLVICRQRPGTASGIVFMTLEDESGFVNVVVFKKVFERNAIFIKTTGFLGVAGKIQSEEGVVHVIAERFFAPGSGRADGVGEVPEVESYDFH